MRQPDLHALVRNRMPWQRVIHKQHGDARTPTRDPGVDRLMQAVNQEAFVPKPMQQLEGPVRRLGNAMQIEQAESAVKRHGRKCHRLHDPRRRSDNGA